MIKFAKPQWVKASAEAAANFLWRLYTAPLIALYTLLEVALWVMWAFKALICDMKVKRRKIGPMVMLYQNVVAGYHPNSVADEAWAALKNKVATEESRIVWTRLCRFRLCYDDHFSKPLGETCRSAVGFIIAPTCIDAEATVAEWKRHPLAAIHGLKVGIFPACECLAVELPYYGPLSHGVALARALLLSMALSEKGTLRSAVPGILQICDPMGKKISFLCPQEGRKEMLGFQLHEACYPLQPAT